jgi:hypothetical protein
MFRGMFQRQNLCVVDPISDGLNPTYIDHIAFLGWETVTTKPMVVFEDGPMKMIDIVVFDGSKQGSKVQINCPTLIMNRTVMLYTTTLQDLEAAGANSPKTQMAPLTVQLSLSVDHQGTYDQLTISYSGLNGDTINDLKADGQDPVKVATQLSNLVPTVSTPIDLTSALSSLGISGFTPISVWSGIAASADFQQVEIRFELQTDSTPGVASATPWNQFYNHQGIDNLIDDQDWALFLDQQFFIDSISATLTPILKNTAGFRLDSGPSFSWSSGLPGVEVNLNGDLLSACQCWFDSIDVNTDITMDMSFSIDQGQLRVDLHIRHNENEWQTLCCEITAAVFWPILDLFKLNQYGGWPWYFAGLAAGPIPIFIVAIYKISTLPPPFPTPANFTQDPNDSWHYFSEIPVALNQSPDGSFKLTQLHGTSAGLVLQGTFTDNNLSAPTIQVKVDQFGWGLLDVSCASLGSPTASADIQVSRASGVLDFYFCNAHLVGPTATDFQPSFSISDTYSPFTVAINLITQRDIAGSPQILIQTTGGVRLITLGTIPQLTPEEIIQFQEEAKRWQIETCYTLLDAWFQYFKTFNPKWLVDPAQNEGDPPNFLWQFAFAELNPADRVVIGPEAGDPVVTGTASAEGTLEVSAIINANVLSLVREPAITTERASAVEAGSGRQGKTRSRARQTSDSSSKKRPMETLKEVRLDPVTTITEDSPVLGMLGGQKDGTKLLAVTTTTGASIFEISSHGSVKTLQTFKTPFIGAIKIDGHLIGRTPAGTLIDISTLGGISPAMDSTGNRSKEVARALTGGATHVVSIGSELLTLRGGLIYPAESNTPISGLPHATTIENIGRNLLVGNFDGAYELYHLEKGLYKLAVRYLQRPWFATATQMGSWLVVLGADLCTIKILIPGAARTL